MPLRIHADRFALSLVNVNRGSRIDRYLNVANTLDDVLSRLSWPHTSNQLTQHSPPQPAFVLDQGVQAPSALPSSEPQPSRSSSCHRYRSSPVQPLPQERPSSCAASVEPHGCSGRSGGYIHPSAPLPDTSHRTSGMAL